MTSTNDGKDVKSNQTSGPKGKTYYIELYKSLEAGLSRDCELRERTQHLCEAWRRIHSLCQHSAPSTHPHLVSWLQRHTARIVLQTEWQSPKSKEEHKSLDEAINAFIKECENRSGSSRDAGPPPWETQLVARGEWFKKILGNPWGHPVLRVLLDPRGEPPSDEEVLEWLKEERGVMFVTRLRQLTASKCDDLALSLSSAVMERVRASAATPADTEAEQTDVKDKPKADKKPTFEDILKNEAGFTVDVWELLVDMEFVLLHKGDKRSRCIELAKQTPLRNGYQLVERLQSRLETSPREKKLWKNAKEVATLIAQVVITRCMVVPICSGAPRTALYCCARSLVRALGPRLPPAARALAAPAATARHLHTLAAAVDAQSKEDMKPFVCELYVRAITAGMNELERLKLKTEKESDARSAEQTLASWFTQLGALLSASERIRCECTLTAFSVHPTPAMYERIKAAPTLPPLILDDQEIKEEPNKEFGSWASDSRGQTNFVKTSETLNLKHTQHQANVLSTAIFSEGEVLGISPELCTDIAVLLSGPRLKTLSWDTDRELLLENCRTYMERTNFGTRALTTELKYLNLDPREFQHLPEEEDDDTDKYYGIEKGYEHLVEEYQEPEEIWQDADDPERTESAHSSEIESETPVKTKKAPRKTKKILSSEDDSDPLSLVAEAKRVEKKKERPHSKERSKDSKEKSKEPKKSKSKAKPKDPLEIKDQSTEKKKEPKKKKERKKKEKSMPVTSKCNLSNLIGMKVVNAIKKPDVPCVVNTPSVSGSDYDNQGKSSNSILSDNSETNVLFDGLFSMDELKSPEKNPDMKTLTTNSELHIANDTVGVSTSVVHHNESPSRNNASKHKGPNSPQSRTGSPSNMMVKESLSKLLHYRRQKAIEMEQRINLQPNVVHTYSYKEGAEIPTITPASSPVPVTPEASPKPQLTVNVPENPKVYINKTQSEQLSELRNEVNNLLSAKTFGIARPVIQYGPKANNCLLNNTQISGSRFPNPSLQKQMQDMYKMPQTQEKPTTVGSTESKATPSRPNVPNKQNSVDSASQQNFHIFLKELQESINAGAGAHSRKKVNIKKEMKPISRVTPVVPKIKAEPKTSPQCAKQSQKKTSDFLNTFSRLSYLHKNKVDPKINGTKPVVDALIEYQSKTLQNPPTDAEINRILMEQKMAAKALQIKNEPVTPKSDRAAYHHPENSQSLLKKFDKPKHVSNTVKQNPIIANILSSQIAKSVKPENQYRNVQMERSREMSTIPNKFSSLTERDQQDLLALLRQQTKLNLRPKVEHVKEKVQPPQTITGHMPSTNYSVPCTSQSSNNHKILEAPNITYNNVNIKQVTKPSPSIKPSKPSNVNLDLKMPQAKPLNMVKTEVNCTKTVDPKPIKKIEILSNIEIKSSIKPKPETVAEPKEETDWEKVMDAILSHKTPSRGPKALDMALNKDAYNKALAESLRNQRIVKASSTGDLIKMTNVISKGQSKPALTADPKLSPHPPVLSRSNTESVIKTIKKSSKTPAKVVQKPSTNTSVLQVNPNVIRPMQPETPKRQIQTEKRLSHGTKTQIDVLKKLPVKHQEKQFTAPYYKEEDPFISGIPNSDYDLLEALMDDDLRQEIGELSSDEDNYTAPMQSLKGKNYSINKPITPAIQEDNRLNTTVINTAQAHKKPVPKVRSDIPNPAFDSSVQKQHTSALVNVKSMVKTAEYINNEAKNVQTTIAIHQMPQTVIAPSKNRRNQSYHASTDKLRAVDQTTFVASTPRQTALKNVVLIGSDIVYQPSRVQTPALSANVTHNTYVKYNNQQNMALYQTTQFAAPVVNPVIIGNAITVSKTMTPMAAPLTTVANKPEILVQTPKSKEDKTTINDAVQNKTVIHDTKVAKSEPKTNPVDNPNDDNAKSEKEKVDINSNKNVCERKVLSEVQEKQKLEKIEPKNTRSQTRKSFERELMNEVIKDQERLQKKRLSIINRNISHRIDKKAIPLSYAPLKSLKIIIRVPKAAQEKYEKVKYSSDTKKYSKIQSATVKSIKAKTTEEPVEAKVITKLDKPDKTIKTESYKENKDKPSCRRILLRSSSKDLKLHTEVAEEVSVPRKTKVRLKRTPTESENKTLENCTGGHSINKLKVAKKPVTKKTLNKTIKKAEGKRKATKIQPKRTAKVTINRKSEPKPQEVLPNEMTDLMDIEDEIITSKILEVMSPDKPIPPLQEIPNVEEILGDIEENRTLNDSIENCPSPSILENDFTLNHLIETESVDKPINDSTVVTQENVNKNNDVLNKEDDTTTEITENVIDPVNKDTNKNTTAEQNMTNTDIVKEIERYVKNLKDRIKETATSQHLELECNEIMFSSKDVTETSEQSSQPDKGTSEIIAPVKQNTNNPNINNDKAENQENTVHVEEDIICIDEDDEDPNYIIPPSKILIKGGKINSPEKRKNGLKDYLPQSYMDAILIEDLPHLNTGDPLKKYVRIQLPCGKVFKATVHGQMNTDTKSLFSDPALKSVLLSNVSKRTRYTLNIKQMSTTSKFKPEKVLESHIHEIRLKGNALPSGVVVETIDLLSDSDEETQQQSFNTEYGKYQVQTMNKNLLENHQKLFDKKCVVKLKRKDLQKYLDISGDEDETETSVETCLMNEGLPAVSLQTDEPTKNIEPAVEFSVQPITEPVVEPENQDAETVIQSGVQPMIHPEVQPVIQSAVQSFIQTDGQSIIQPQDQNVIQHDVHSNEQSGVQPITRPDVRPISEPVEQPVISLEDFPVIESVIKYAVQPIMQSDVQSIIQSEHQPLIQPDVQPITEPDVQTDVQPIIHSDEQPTDDQPVTEPIIQSEVQHEVQAKIQLDKQTVIQPVILSDDVSQPDVQPIVQPDAQPITQPDVKAMVKTDVQPITQSDVEPMIEIDVTSVIQSVQRDVQPVMQSEEPITRSDDKTKILLDVEPVAEQAIVTIAKPGVQAIDQIPSESPLTKPTQQEPVEVIEIDDSSNDVADVVDGDDSDAENTIVGLVPSLDLDESTLKDKTAELFIPAQKNNSAPVEAKINEFKHLLFRDLGIEDLAENSTQSDDFFLSFAGAPFVTDSGNSVSNDFSPQIPTLPDCLVKLTRCDELVRKYENLKLLKKCFIKLVRCDELVRSHTEKANEQGSEQSDDIIDIQDNMFEDTAMDIVSLSRCGSFSILDNCDLFDTQSIDQIDRSNSPVIEAYEAIASLCNRKVKVTVEKVTTYGRSTCETEWLLTKPKIHLQHKNSSIEDHRSIERCNAASDSLIINKNNVLPLKALVLKLFHNHSILDQINSARLKSKLNIRPLTPNRKRKSLETIVTDSKIAKNCDNSSQNQSEDANEHFGTGGINVMATDLLDNTRKDCEIEHDKTMEASSFENSIIEVDSRTSCFDGSEDEISASILDKADLMQTEFYINNEKPQFQIDGVSEATELDTELIDEDLIPEIENICQFGEINVATDTELISEVGKLDVEEICNDGVSISTDVRPELTKATEKINENVETSLEIVNISEDVLVHEGTPLDTERLLETGKDGEKFRDNGDAVLKDTEEALEKSFQSADTQMDATEMVTEDICETHTHRQKCPAEPEMLTEMILEDTDAILDDNGIATRVDTKLDDSEMITKDNICNNADTTMAEQEMVTENICENAGSKQIEEPEIDIDGISGDANTKLAEPETASGNVCEDTDATLVNTGIEKETDIEPDDPVMIIKDICNNADTTLTEPEMATEIICENTAAILGDTGIEREAIINLDESEIVIENICNNDDTKMSEPARATESIREDTDAILIDTGIEKEAVIKLDEPEIVMEGICDADDSKFDEPEMPMENVCVEADIEIETTEIEEETDTNLEQPDIVLEGICGDTDIVLAESELPSENICEDSDAEIETIEKEVDTNLEEPEIVKDICNSADTGAEPEKICEHTDAILLDTKLENDANAQPNDQQMVMEGICGDADTKLAKSKMPTENTETELETTEIEVVTNLEEPEIIIEGIGGNADTKLAVSKMPMENVWEDIDSELKTTEIEVETSPEEPEMVIGGSCGDTDTKLAESERPTENVWEDPALETIETEVDKNKKEPEIGMEDICGDADTKLAESEMPTGNICEDADTVTTTTEIETDTNLEEPEMVMEGTFNDADTKSAEPEMLMENVCEDAVTEIETTELDSDSCLEEPEMTTENICEYTDAVLVDIETEKEAHAKTDEPEMPNENVCEDANTEMETIETEKEAATNLEEPETYKDICNNTDPTMAEPEIATENICEDTDAILVDTETVKESETALDEPEVVMEGTTLVESEMLMENVCEEVDTSLDEPEIVMEVICQYADEELVLPVIKQTDKKLEEPETVMEDVFNNANTQMATEDIREDANTKLVENEIENETDTSLEEPEIVVEVICQYADEKLVLPVIDAPAKLKEPEAAMEKLKGPEMTLHNISENTYTKQLYSEIKYDTQIEGSDIVIEDITNNNDTIQEEPEMPLDLVGRLDIVQTTEVKQEDETNLEEPEEVVEDICKNGDTKLEEKKKKIESMDKKFKQIELTLRMMFEDTNSMLEETEITIENASKEPDTKQGETDIVLDNIYQDAKTGTDVEITCAELCENMVENADKNPEKSDLVRDNSSLDQSTIFDIGAKNNNVVTDFEITVICEEVDETIGKGEDNIPDVIQSETEDNTIAETSAITTDENEVYLNRSKENQTVLNYLKLISNDHKPQEVSIECKDETRFYVSEIDDNYLVEEVVEMSSDEILDDEMTQVVLASAISQVNEVSKHVPVSHIENEVSNEELREPKTREFIHVHNQDTNLKLIKNNVLYGEHSGSLLMDFEDDKSSEEIILITQQIGEDGQIEEIDIKLNVPKITYSKRYPHGLIFNCLFGDMKNRKRKIDLTDVKIYGKRYRKGKHIDLPTMNVTDIGESGYGKEFKQLLDYCSTVKFSYSRPFHKECINVQEILQSWPIKGICDVEQSETEKDETLFTDMEKEDNTIHDPSIQTLAEEIDSNDNESNYKSCDVIETNFNMGFGEGSGRVIQNLEDGCGTKFSAATLSDVKQTQPLLLSENYGNCTLVHNTINFTNKHEIEKLHSNIKCIQMKDKVRSFFKKSMTELSYDWMKQQEKDDMSYSNGLFDSSDFPYGLTDPDFIQPPQFEAIVQVVQVGQLPVSAAAQNPVTCDPRVTQVSNVSPSQCSAENSPGDDQSVIKTEYTELTTADLSMPLAQEYVQHIQSMPMPPHGHEAMNYPMGSNYAVDVDIKPEIKIEMEEAPEIKEEINDNYENSEYPPLFEKNMMNSVDYSHITPLEPNSNVTMMYNYTDKQSVPEAYPHLKQQEHLQMQQQLHQQQQQQEHYQQQQQQEQYQQQQKLIQQQLEQEQQQLQQQQEFQQRQIELQQLQLEQQQQQKLQEMQQLQLKQQQEEQKQQQLRLQELKQQELKEQQEQQEQKHQQHLLELKRAQDLKQQQQQQQQELKQQKQQELKQQQQRQKELKQQQQLELKQQKRLEQKQKQQKQQELKQQQQKQQELKQQQLAQLKQQKQQQQELKQQQLKQQKQQQLQQKQQLKQQQELQQKQQLKQQQELQQKQQMQQQQELQQKQQLQQQQELQQKQQLQQQQELQQKQQLQQQQELQQKQQLQQQQELQQKQQLQQQQELQQKQLMQQQQQELQQKQQIQQQQELQQKQQIQQQQQQQEQQQLLQQQQQQQHNGSLDKTDQIAHAMNAAGISSTADTLSNNRAQAIVNMISQKLRQGGVTTGQSSNNFQKTTSINAMALQQALAQILPPPLNQTNASENNQQTSNTHTPQVLHIVQGKSSSGNHQQITLVENTQQSVINAPNSTPLLHIVQNKTVPPGPASNGTPTQQTNSFSGLSLVDGGLQQGNQLLHIVNAGHQKNANAGQLLKRVNLLTNLTNAQGGNEQKMVQFVCKSADGKAIQLNGPHQRSMVLRLQPVETPNLQQTQPKQIDSQDLSPTHNAANNKDAEIKSRSIYEENYAKFIQSSSPKTPGPEKGTSLPKFNQAFGKQVYQDGGQKNEISTGNAMSPNDDNPDCQANDNAMSLEHISQIGSPPLLLRKPATSQAQPNLVQQLKQTISPMNLHGGVIYTRQIPVNLASGQTINLITVPSSDLVDESNQKQQGEIEPSIIKIVPQNQTHSNSDGTEENNTHTMGTANDNAHTPQPQPVLTQMRIKLPMLSKAPQMVSGGRVVRPSFFQIQRNVISGTNQPVYQQLVLTAAPQLGQQTIRLPQAQTSQTTTTTSTTTTRPAAVKATPSESQSSTESMSSSTLEQLREFDLVLEQVKERSTVQPKSKSKRKKEKAAEAAASAASASTSAASAEPSRSTPAPHKQHQVLYSIGNTQPLNVAYVNRKAATPAPASTPTPTTSTFVRSPDSSGIVDSSPSSSSQIPHTVTSEPSTSSDAPAQSKSKSSSKSKSRPKASSNPPNTLKLNTTPPKPSTQKPAEDEQTTQRILYILAEYKEQVENSPDKDKPAPRRRTNPPSNPGSSKRKRSRRNRDLSPADDSCRTMGSEDSSCGTSQGDCNESCVDSHSPQDSPRKVVRKLTFEHETSAQSAPPTPQPRPQPQQRNVIVSDGQTITVARGTAGKPSTAVLMPANYILPVSMIKGGQQIAIVTNRGPKLLTVGGGEGGATNALLLQRLIGPPGVKPLLTRPGVRHVRLPAAALHNLQAFNLATASTIQPPDSTASPAPGPTPPELIETRANSSPWRTEGREESKPERGSSPEGEPWHLPATANPHDYSYEEVVRTDNMDRTVLVVQKKDGSHHRQHRLTHVSAAALRHKYAILEHELRLQEYLSQKSLSEECEDLGVDSPSASELFPEAELLFAASPAHDHTQDHGHHSHTPQPLLHHSSIPQPDIDDQIATDQLLPRSDMHDDRSDLGIGLEDVGIVTVSEDGMQATIALDQEEFARSHPNTTFHSEPTDEGEVQPFTISGLKGRHITSTIFHANRAPGTVLMTAPQTTVISQATAEGSGVHNTVKYADIDNMINSLPGPHTHSNINLSSVLVKDDGLTRFDSILNDNRELHLSNTASHIVHATGNNTTQVIRRVCYGNKREQASRFLIEESDNIMARHHAKMMEDSRGFGDVDDDGSSPERTELFWESNSASERDIRRPLDFSSDSDKCCKSPSFEENNSTDSSGLGAHMRLDSVIKDARGIERRASADGSSADDNHAPPLRTYPPKRMYQALDAQRSLTGKTRAPDVPERQHAPERHDVRDVRDVADRHHVPERQDNVEGRRRASGRGVVKRGCHCCNGDPAPPRPKKPRQRKPNIDFTTN